MKESKGEILSDEQRTSRSKAWKQAIVGTSLYTISDTKL
jgi:hypothetical protein